MQTREIVIGDKTYQLKFGLGSLIRLAQNPNINVGDNIDYNIVCYEGLRTLQPYFRYNLLFQISQGEIKDVVSEIFSPSDIPSPQTIEEWYRKGIGEIGLPLSDFYCLTPYELDIIYEGYLRKMELQANLVQLGVLRALNNNKEPIKIVEERETSLGTIKERQEMLSRLGL